MLDLYPLKVFEMGTCTELYLIQVTKFFDVLHAGLSREQFFEKTVREIV